MNELFEPGKGASDDALRSLGELVAELGSDPAFRGRRFSKSELIELLSRKYDGDPAVAAESIRLAAKGSGMLGAVQVRCEGERRGTKYSFGPGGQTVTDSVTETDPLAPPRAQLNPGGIRDFPSPACPPASGTIEVFQGDNLAVLKSFQDSTFDLIYIDPPFNTGRTQSRTRIKTERDEAGDRVGYQGQRYRTTVIGSSSYADTFDDYMAFLVPRLEEAFRLLKPKGSFFLHLDFREVHYAKVALDRIFGRDSFINEIIWAYDYGARATNRWSPKHDNILWYAKSPNDYCFNYDEIDRIPYMAPSLVGEEKAARGKTPTDTWWNTIVSPNGKEKTGYPTQKPLSVLTRLVRVHSKPGDSLLDFFAGSGSLGEAAASFGRNATLVDESPEAIAVMRRRFANFSARFTIPDGAEQVDSSTFAPTQEAEIAVTQDVLESTIRESCAAPKRTARVNAVTPTQGSLF